MQAAARRPPPSEKSEKAAAPRGADRLHPKRTTRPATRRENPARSALALREPPSVPVSSPGDPNEREADRVADSIIRMPAIAGTKACMDELQKLPGFKPAASEMHYVGDAGDVLEDLAEVPVK